MVKAPIFPGAIKLRNVLDRQVKNIGSGNGSKQGGFADTRSIIFRLFIAIQWFFWGHLTCFASRVKAAYNGSFGGRGNKARLPYGVRPQASLALG